MHDEGYIKGTEWHYYLKDHLGNTRVDFVANGTSTRLPLLPFCMDLTGLNKNQTDNKYNGKEHDEALGLDWYYYGAGFYMGDLGRFICLDPIAEDFNWVTPYNYAENSPIANIDLWGLQKVYYSKAIAVNKKFQKFMPSSDKHQEESPF